MKDQDSVRTDLKNLFKSMKHEKPNQIQMARWKKVVRKELLNKTPAEWTRLAVACLIGFMIGAVSFKNSNSTNPQDQHQVTEKNIMADATIERVHVNLD